MPSRPPLITMAVESAVFSSSGADAITRQLDVGEAPSFTSRSELEQFYEIERTAREITQAGYKRTALQFPDELLHDSVTIYRMLKARIQPDQELYVLADTSYGSCCVDEVAASHVDANAIVHYGHACLSQPSRIPVIFIFGTSSLDIERCVSSLTDTILESSIKESGSKTVLFKHDVIYQYVADEIINLLRDRLSNDGIAVHYNIVPLKMNPLDTRPQLTDDATNPTSNPKAAPTYDLIVYVGGESLTLTNILLTNPTTEVRSYDPTTRSTRLESIRTNRILMRRYAILQKARDADVIGILVGTLGVGSYLPLITHLRKLIASAHKKSYTLAVGKLNPAKLANFIEIECFVVVACPENSVIESKEFLRPIVTPYELELALQSTQPGWGSDYVLDFNKLLATAGASVKETTGEEEGGLDEDRPSFSLVSGTYRQAKKFGVPDNSSEQSSSTLNGTVIVREKDGTVVTLKDSAAGQFLQNRTYRGLEQRIGEDSPGLLEQGRSGIPRGYADDKKHDNQGS